MMTSLPICKMGFDEVLVYRAPEMKRLVMGQDADSLAQGQPRVHFGGGGRCELRRLGGAPHSPRLAAIQCNPGMGGGVRERKQRTKPLCKCV